MVAHHHIRASVARHVRDIKCRHRAILGAVVHRSIAIIDIHRLRSRIKILVRPHHKRFRSPERHAVSENKHSDKIIKPFVVDFKLRIVKHPVFCCQGSCIRIDSIIHEFSMIYNYLDVRRILVCWLCNIPLVDYHRSVC